MEKKSKVGVGTMMVIVAFFLIFLAQAASAQPGEFVKGVLQPLADGFPNLPIVLMVIDEVGSPDSLYATVMLDTIRKMSPVPVVIEHREDFSAFGTWEAIRWIMDQGKVGNDGYLMYVFAIPGMIGDLLVIDMKTEVGLDINDFNVVEATEVIPYVLCQRPKAPWGETVQDLIAYGKKNPAKLRHISVGPGGMRHAAMQWYSRQWGFTMTEIVASTPAHYISLANGDADVSVLPVDGARPHWEAGKLKVLMVSGSNPSPPPWESVPNAAAVGLKNDPFCLTRGFGVSPQTPESHRLWLVKLLTAVAKDEGYIIKRKMVPGLTNIILDKQAVLKRSQDGYDFVLPIAKDMGFFWGDKKK